MTEPIRGKVAQLLNSREVALNIGAEQGVVVGMRFDIMEPEGINDPDTGESLGAIDRPKVRVQVAYVQEKLSVATTYRTERVNIGGTFDSWATRGSFSRALMPPRWITKYETLKTEEKTWEDLDEEASVVKTGDRVIQVIAEPDAEQKDVNS